MLESRVVLWAVFLVACDGSSATTVSAEPLPSRPPPLSVAARRGGAGEPALSEDELDRMLDALEKELERSEPPR